MKSNTRSSLYFLAYPLKALKQEPPKTTQSQSPFLKAILSGKTRTLTRVRVLPMVNPYSKKIRVSSVKPAKNIEPEGKDWFNNYE